MQYLWVVWSPVAQESFGDWRWLVVLEDQSCGEEESLSHGYAVYDSYAWVFSTPSERVGNGCSCQQSNGSGCMERKSFRVLSQTPQFFDRRREAVQVLSWHCGVVVEYNGDEDDDEGFGILDREGRARRTKCWNRMCWWQGGEMEQLILLYGLSFFLEICFTYGFYRHFGRINQERWLMNLKITIE